MRGRDAPYPYPSRSAAQQAQPTCGDSAPPGWGKSKFLAAIRGCTWTPPGGLPPASSRAGTGSPGAIRLHQAVRCDEYPQAGCVAVASDQKVAQVSLELDQEGPATDHQTNAFRLRSIKATRGRLRSRRFRALGA